MTPTDRQARDLPLDAHLHTDLSPDSNVPDRRLRAAGARARDRRDRHHRPRRLRARRAGLRATRRSTTANGSSATRPSAGGRRASHIRFGVELTYDRSWEADIRDHLRRHAYDFTIGSVHDPASTRRTARARVARLGRGPVAGRDRRAVLRRGRGRRPGPGCSMPSATSTSSSATCYPHVTPAAFEAAPELYEPILRALVESGHGARGQHQRPAPPDPASPSRTRRSSPASASSAAGPSRSAPTPTAPSTRWGLADGYAIAADAGFEPTDVPARPGTRPGGDSGHRIL